MTVVLVVAVLLALVATFASRSAWQELKNAGNRMRAAQAAEAAESGLAWALARLDDDRPVDDACHAAAEGPSFGESYLGEPAMASCALREGAWECRCPAAGAGAMAGDARAAQQAFALRLHRAASGVVTVESTGCSGPTSACLASTPQAAPPEARTARVRVDVARIPAVDVRPVAAITARGSLQLRDAPTVIHHGIASGALTLHAGAAADPGDALLAGPPGAPPQSTIVARDAALASLDAAQFFASTFRMDRSTWRNQAAARVLDCTSPCDGALVRQLTPAGAPALLWLEGGLHLNSPTELGSPARPVLLVADGPVELRGRARIHGVIYLRSADWHDEAGASIRGALLAENDLLLAGPTRIEHDAAAIEQLRQCCGSHARMPASWRDF